MEVVLAPAYPFSIEELLFGCFKNPRFCVLGMALFFVHIIII